jgi:hypothetical protein
MTKYIHRVLDHTQMEFYISNNITEKTIIGDREILEGREIDIFVPSLKLGIEYNGEYFHSSKYRDDSYHLWKTENCSRKGIQLFHCFEFDNPDIFIDKAKYYSNSLEKIGARKTKVKCTDDFRYISNYVETNTTYQDHDFLSKCKRFKYLEYNGDIVSLLGINNENECLYIPKKDVVTIGGMTKLLKGENLTIVVNRNYSEGYSLKKLGYTLVDIVKPFLMKGCYNVGLYKFKL